MNMKLFFWVIRLVIFLIVLVFALGNQNEVTVHLVPGYTWTTALIWALAVAILLGIALGISAMMPLWLKQRRLATQANKQLKLQATTLPAAATGKPDPTDSDELGI
jgi:putative membrane protein